jgi:hypothetical protein
MPSPLSPYRPSPERPWNRRRAAHLLRRAGFAPAAGEIDAAVADGPDKTVDRLLSPPAKPTREYSDILSAAEVLVSTGDVNALRAAWLLRMIHTDRPLIEKMTLFWHGHFATSIAKVGDGRLMQEQIALLRAGGLGRFGPLLEKVTADPAMILWLDNNTNRKGHANENYAREIMELFSLGVGHYTEADIREAGRAFTGWHTDRRRFTFNRDQFDDGEKTVFGETGRFGGTDVVRLCLRQPACPRFIAGKLFRFFVHENPSPELLAELADGFRRTDLDVAALMRTLLLSEEFHSDRAYRALIKSPVELAVGAIRSLGARVNAGEVAKAAAEAGQSLLEPPTVKGWDGGRAWLNSATVLTRAHLLQGLCQGGGKLGPGVPAGEILASHKLRDAAAATDFLLDVLVQTDVPEGVRGKLLAYAGGAGADIDEAGFRGLAQLVMGLPEYQLG